MTKIVLWVDDNGYKHRSIMPEKFKLSSPKEGFPDDPPSLDLIDWEEVKKKLHNLLVERELITLDDLQGKDNRLSNAILLSIRPQLVELFKRQLEVNKNARKYNSPD